MIWRSWPFILAIAGITALFAVVLFAPEYVIGSRRLSLTASERLEAESGIRSSILQLLGGLVLVAGLYFTARGFRLTREGHITDRYAKAIEQLGNLNADVRIGGIYALEKIARDSPADRDTIIDVLATFVREHTKSGHNTPSTEEIGADVQAAIYVIGRRPGVADETRRLDFYHSGLNDADFAGGDFRGAMFDYSRLHHARFSGAKLDGADLSFCDARVAAFTDASARGAHFVNAAYTHGWFLAADLRDTDFYGCDLTESDFGRRYAEEGHPPLPAAVLTNARFTAARLTGTILKGVDLSTVRGLTKEQLQEAITDRNTVLPTRWRSSEDED